MSVEGKRGMRMLSREPSKGGKMIDVIPLKNLPFILREPQDERKAG